MEAHQELDSVNLKNNSQVSSIDFKSSFARSLSVHDEVLERENSDKFLNDCAEIDKLKDKSDETIYFNVDNGYNKSDEDKQLWIIKEKKMNQILNGSNNIEDMNANEAEIEIIRLRKECQTLVELNRRLNMEHSDPYHDRKNSVQNAVLQSKVETLEWQLKQVENSRDMYRAILEEVTRYLETCHMTFENWLHHETTSSHDITKIERSKSILCVAQRKDIDDHHTMKSNSSSSTMNLNCSTPYSIRQKSATLFSEPSYNSFKDFTKRKCTTEESSINGNILPGHESVDANSHSIEKLSKPCFRLLRTVQNFLSTNEPSLTSNEKIENKNSSLESTLEASKSIAESLIKSKNPNFEASNSLEHHNNHHLHHQKNEEIYVASKNVTKSTKRFSTTEDESGFSSMSSFHEIGLPKIETLTENRCLRNKETHGIKRSENGSVAMAREEVIEGDENSYRVLWV